MYERIIIYYNNEIMNDKNNNERIIETVSILHDIIENRSACNKM